MLKKFNVNWFAGHKAEDIKPSSRRNYAGKQTGNKLSSSGAQLRSRRGQKAFTLAEVLISLTIIGIIAAITVPALIQRTNKQEYVTALQKAYNTLSQAANMIIAEHGSPKADENGESWLSDVNSVYNMFKKYLINAKDCGAAKGCFMQGDYKPYGGGALDPAENYIFSRAGGRRLILSDGMQINFSHWGLTNKCNTSGFGSISACALIFIDVNGEKGPNTIAKDVFAFALKENGLYPSGCDESFEPCPSVRGYGCACKVLKEGAMNY